MLKITQVILLASVFVLSGCGHTVSDRHIPATPKRPEAGITDNEIILGSSSPLSGHAEYFGANYTEGAVAYFNYINDSGGVHGRKIKVISYDDQYDPPRCVANTQKLINEDKVFALFNYFGSATSKKIVPLIEEAGVPLIGIYSGADELRNPVKKNVFNVRGSYYLEIERAIMHFIEDLGLSRIAVFYQNDAFGLDGLRGAEIGLSKYGLEVAAKESYERGGENVDKAIGTIGASDAEAVIMVGIYSPCAMFVKEMRKAGKDPYFYALSPIAGEKFVEEAGEESEGIIVSQVVPPPDSEILPSARLYKKALEKYFPASSINYVGYEGFLNAMVLVEGLKKSGRDISRGSFIEAIEAFSQVCTGTGVEINYSPTDHEGFDYIYFTVFKNKELDFFSDWNTVKKLQ